MIYRDQIRPLFEAVRFRDDLRFDWCGRPQSPEAPVRALRADPGLARAHLLDRLRARLYRCFYTSGGTLSEPEAAAIGEGERRRVLADLGASFEKSFYADDGWDPSGREGRLWLLSRDGLTIRAAAKGPLRRPVLNSTLFPGFALLVGRAGPDDPRRGPVFRFYWNLPPLAAPRLLRAAAAAFNGRRIPFKMKALVAGEGDRRGDRVVLYVGRRFLDEARRRVEALYADVAADLEPFVPALTLPLAPGLAFAQDPGDAESFGQHRCRLIADALLLSRGEDAERFLRRVEARFDQEGIDLDAPYVTRAERKAAPGPLRARVEPAPRPSPLAPRPGSRLLLAAAEEIGDRVLARAVRAGGRLGFVDLDTDPEAALGGRKETRLRSLGGDLYSGTAGIAWFLAELYGARGGARLREAAVAAARTALGDRSLGGGLYAGRLGVALAAAHVGRLCGRKDLAAAAPAGGRADGADLMYGTAGRALGLLALGCREAAAREGDRLIREARRGRRGWSWPVPGRPRAPGLTGWSHGAAGVAAALLELYRETGRARYRDAAARAFDYERSWFLPERGNWADLRDLPGAPPADRRAPGMSWCHGAPGIALSRRRAVEVTGEAARGEELEAALRATRAGLADALGASADACLCHGLAGNAEILALAGTADDAPLIGAAAAEVVRRLRRGDATWASREGEPEALGLLTGLSGIGLFLLRLADPRRPSVLDLR